MKTFLRAAAVAVLTFICTVPAAMAATPDRQITISGLFDGASGGNTFSNIPPTPFTNQRIKFIGLFDSSQGFETFGEQWQPLTTLLIMLDGNVLETFEPTMFFINPADSLSGLTKEGGVDSIVRFALDGTNTFVPGIGENLATVDLGSFNVTDGRNISFSISSVPEPTTWAMMIVGFAAAGGTMRRRNAARRLTVTFGPAPAA